MRANRPKDESKTACHDVPMCWRPQMPFLRGWEKIAYVIGFCCYLFSRLDISPTTGDFLRDPMVTNEDKYWTQMAGMLQFEHNLNTLTLFSESLDYQGTIIYQAGAEQ